MCPEETKGGQSCKVTVSSLPIFSHTSHVTLAILPCDLSTTRISHGHVKSDVLFLRLGRRKRRSLLMPQRHEYEIVVCHGNVIRFFALRALQLPPEAWLRLSLYNCSISHLRIAPTGNVSLITLGDIGHLPPELNTYGTKVGFED